MQLIRAMWDAWEPYVRLIKLDSNFKRMKLMNHMCPPPVVIMDY